ncbi:ligase-associated DNA damage response endonuclease PdeM [Segnochrobactrum spirostomi]|uniref:Ligase-associated DNA damage response endonuclease PdeM n=1 Tax=Segnochrobactrum spirostomi TaxID=2608987 RepID=A0A6A7Y5A5_9HYPH|nr:ligase-associated DNA damage response endonuclease PdeM [Segnochrobactrum spirostomi]MQT14364.1 ligase-associated DNA damage response endonuclease PdeM [Segnochrobactrum spirostomi]
MNFVDSPPRAEDAISPVTVAGTRLSLHASGALWIAAERLLVVADLHLEKGSSFARTGQFLPPYDTATTLARLEGVVGALDPAAVVALGDSFHDRDGPARLGDDDRRRLARLMVGRDWIWVTGNHDPVLPPTLGGDVASELGVSGLTLRHEPSAGPAPGEVAGHLHPVARVVGRGRSLRRRCFAGDGERLVLPAFGALAGGLNVLDAAFAPILPRGRLRAHLIGEGRLYAFAGPALLPG